MKLRIIAVAVGLSILGCAARANQITFSGVITSAVGSGIFSPPPISIGDSFFGFVTFDAPNTVLAAEVTFPQSGLSIGFSGFFEPTLTPISNGYLFESGQIFPGLNASDAAFGFEFYDNVNSFSASADSFLNPFVNFQTYQGRISDFSVSVPEGGGTMLLLAISLMPVLLVAIKRPGTVI